MISPCIRLCTLEADRGICLGCGRTLAEIGQWMGYSDNQRQAIMAVLPARLAARRPVVEPARNPENRP